VTLILSRYACVRAEWGRLVAEGVGAAAPVRLDEPASLALITALASPRTLAEAAAEAGIAPADAERLAQPLLEAGVLVDADRGAVERDAVWTFHNRLFHDRTRPADRSDWHTTRRPPPALPQRAWEPIIALERPDLDAIERDDPPLARVQAERRSVRVHGPHPLTVSRLGEFLFRVGRVHDIWEMLGATFVSRPYPSAGALYELELYVAVGACSGVEPGLYHYAGDHHHLARTPAPAGNVERLLSDAAAGMGVSSEPQVLIVLAARYPRIAVKYGPLAYSLVLKNVGVVMQTMYLSATAMGLAGCAVGAGDAALFAEATGLAVEDETSVGEFCIGEPREPGL
jgi:SagB-type dehydrogenase family enzyme